METDAIVASDQALAARLRALRAERGWSLDELARRSGVSRAALSRMENAEVSPTASVLNRLAAAYGLTMSRLIRMVEADYEPLVRQEVQPVWRDPAAGFHRRSVSPPSRALAGEAIEARLDPGTTIAYEAAPRPGLEHHLVLIDGALTVTVEGASYRLKPGDCLRYQLFGPSTFATPAEEGARYFLFMV